MEEELFEDIIAEKFPNLRNETYIQVQKAQKAPSKINPKWTTSKYTVIKMAKTKEKSKRIHILFKCTWNIIQDRSHARPQNKPP